MNKPELISAIAESANISKATAGLALDGVVDAIISSLKKEEKVSLIGFGTFSVRKRAEREGRNPKTGEPIKIVATKIPSFKAGKMLKDAVK